MISYELSEEQSIVRSMIGDLAAQYVRPAARRMDDAGSFDDAVLAALWSTQIIQSQASDDMERSAVTNAIVLEELGAADASLALATAATLGYACAIRDQGSATQRAALEAQLQTDTFSAAAIALMEPRFGATTAGFTMAATRADDAFVLSGTKIHVPLAARCSHFLVVAECAGRTEAFIVPSDCAGVRIAEPRGTLGVRAAALADVHFDGVQVPPAMRLGEDGGADIQRIIDGSRIALAAIMAGMNRETLGYVIPYVKERRIDGTPLAQRQSIAFNIADSHIDTEAMRWMTWKAAWQLEQRASSTRQAQLAFSFAGERTMAIADTGLQALGGHGFVKENPLEMWYRNARTLSVLEGVAGV
jgi:alkylation response protein AidB-like acyl-CoA dehydrogenase